MLNASHIKAHLTGRVRWAAIRRWPALGGLNSKLHLAVDAHGMPVRLLMTGGTTGDRTQRPAIRAGPVVEHLLADRGYDNNEVVAVAHGMNPVIPPKSNRKK